MSCRDCNKREEVEGEWGRCAICAKKKRAEIDAWYPNRHKTGGVYHLPGNP